MRTAAAALLAVAMIGCSGMTSAPESAPAPTSTTPSAAPAPEAKSAAVTRADELVADLKKREAALQAADSGDKPVATESIPIVVEASKSRVAVSKSGMAPSSSPFPTTSTPVPPPAGRRRNSVDVVTSSYAVAERTRALVKFSWRVSVRNQERTPVRVRVEMDFRDIKGGLIGAGDQTIDIAGSTVAEVTGVVGMTTTDAARVARATPRLALLQSP